MWPRTLSFAGEIGAGIGIPSNGGKWLYKWGVDVEAGMPVVLTKLVIHKWEMGEMAAATLLGNYKETFGYHTLAFRTCDLHRILLATALSENGDDAPCKLVTSHHAVDVDAELGQVTFENGEVFTVDLVITADDIHSRMRTAIGITPDISQVSSYAYRHVISKSKDTDHGLGEIGSNNSIEFWSRPGTEKIVIGSNHGGEVLCIYSFFP